MNRDEYLIRAIELAPRGMDLPQSKLMPLDVVAIREAAIRRDAMRREINETLSNAALAEKFGVHVRTIEKVLSYESWGTYDDGRKETKSGLHNLVIGRNSDA